MYLKRFVWRDQRSDIHGDEHSIYNQEGLLGFVIMPSEQQQQTTEVDCQIIDKMILNFSTVPKDFQTDVSPGERWGGLVSMML